MLKVAALAMLIATSQFDGGVYDVERATLVLSHDAGVVDVSGGGWLSDQVLVSTSRELVDLRTQNKELKERPAVTPLGAVIALSVGIAIGAAAVGSIWLTTDRGK